MTITEIRIEVETKKRLDMQQAVSEREAASEQRRKVIDVQKLNI
jgi:hypothetical protein